jgi:hypothetical protein
MNTRQTILLCALTGVLLIGNNIIVSGENPDGPQPPVKAPAPSHVSVTQDIDELIVSFAQNIGTVTVSVEDEAGNIMYETTVAATAGSSLTIDTTGWDSGNYVLTVTDSSVTLYEIVVFVP